MTTASEQGLLELPAGFGTPSGSANQYETFKLKGKDDELVLRILPAMKSLLEIGNWGLYWALHFGWNGINAKDSTKKTYHPFLCIEEKGQGGMITQECPACTYRNSYIALRDSADEDIKKQCSDLAARGKAKGATEAQIAKAVAQLRETLVAKAKNVKDWIQNHGRDGKMRIPCIDKQGRFGIFLAPYGVVIGLKKEMADLKNQTYPGTDVKINPWGRKGVWFRITRTGMASLTSDKVEVSRITRADGSEMKDFHVITDEQLMEAQKRIPDLRTLRDQTLIRLDQIEALVALDKAGGGSPDPVEVDRILEIGKPAAKADPLPDWANDDTPLMSPNLDLIKTPPVADGPAKAPEKTPEAAAEMAVATAVAATVAEPTTPVVNGADMSDAAFDAMFA